jgi:hypothetical protein
MCEPYRLAGLTGHFCIMGGCTGLPNPSGEELGVSAIESEKLPTAELCLLAVSGMTSSVQQ